MLLSSLAGLPATEARAQDEAQSVAPEADKIIREMSDFLAGQETFSYEAEVLYETVYGGNDGDWDLPAEKISSVRSINVTVRRPDHFFVAIEEAPQKMEYFFNGDAIVISDHAAKAYVKKAFSGSIDEVLDLLRKAYNFDPPLSDLMESNLYQSQMEGVSAASYVGMTRLRGRDVHHVAFASDGMDWQVWITTGDQPVPVLLQIMSRNQAFWPLYQAWFTKWEFGMDVSDEVFVFQEPEDGIETQFVNDATLAE